MRALLPLLLLGCSDKGDSGSSGEPGTGAVLERTAFPDCAAPGERTSLGPMAPWSLGAAWDAQPAADDLEYQYTGGGMAVADFNGDGRADVYLPSSGASQLLLSDGDTWVDGSAGLPASEADDLGIGGVAADVDDDGDLDLYTLVLHGQNRLLVNDGTGVFTDGTVAAGLAAGARDTTHATFADVDGDGILDLVVANHYEGPHLGEAIISGEFEPAQDNALFLGDGTGRFVDATDRLPEAFRTGYGFVVIVEDFDRDGVVEMMSVNDFGPFWEPNTVIRREEDTWAVDTQFEGLDTQIYGMGGDVADLNGDGFPDLALTSWMEVVLLLSTGEGSWYRAGAARGVVMNESQTTGWGVVFGDLDNDGDEDISMALGPLVMPPENAAEQEQERGLVTLQDQPDALFEQGSDGMFAERGAEWGVGHTGITRGVLPVDLDGDGWLDLVRRGLDGDAVVFRGRCGTAGALEVSLSQSGPNRNAIGAQIDVEAGGRTAWRRIRAGGQGFGVGGPPSAHIGLGEAATARVRVTWPDGATDVFEGVEPGRVRISRPE